MNARTIGILCTVIVASYAAVFVKGWGAPKGWLIDDAGRPQQTDYLSLWAAGRLAVDGKAVAAYDWQKHEAAMEKGLGYEPPEMLPYSYPPPMFLLLGPLASLPYLPSMLTFSLAMLALFAATSARIIGRPDGALWMCATVPAFWNFAVGQTGALAASLLGAGLLLLPARPLLAGVAFGLLSFKPHLGLLIPLALAASGRWRAVVGATTALVWLAALSLLVFGNDVWAAFPPAMAKFGAFVMSTDNLDVHKLQSVFGALRTLGVPPSIALAAQIIVGLALAALVIVVWSRPGSADLKSGVLAAAVVLATPYVFHYDLIILCVAQAFMLRHALRRGVTVDDVKIIVLVNVLITLSQSLGFPTGVLASAVMLGGLLQRLVAEEPGTLAWPSFRVVSTTRT